MVCILTDNKSGRSNRQPTPSLESEREKVALDISSLKKQYSKLKERQKQVQVILTGKIHNRYYIGTLNIFFEAKSLPENIRQILRDFNSKKTP